MCILFDFSDSFKWQFFNICLKFHGLQYLWNQFKESCIFQRHLVALFSHDFCVVVLKSMHVLRWIHLPFIFVDLCRKWVSFCDKPFAMSESQHEITNSMCSVYYCHTVVLTCKGRITIGSVSTLKTSHIK